jgi:hypothetical protein
VRFCCCCSWSVIEELWLVEEGELCERGVDLLRSVSGLEVGCFDVLLIRVYDDTQIILNADLIRCFRIISINVVLMYAYDSVN